MCLELAGVCGQPAALLQPCASCPFHLAKVQELGIKQQWYWVRGWYAPLQHAGGRIEHRLPPLISSIACV